MWLETAGCHLVGEKLRFPPAYTHPFPSQQPAYFWDGLLPLERSQDITICKGTGSEERKGCHRDEETQPRCRKNFVFCVS